MKLIDKLKKLSISIPEVNPALGSYVPYKRINNLIYISGQLPIVSGEISTGKVPISVSIEDAKSAARVCCLLYTSPSPRDLSTSRMPSSA